MGKRLVCGKGLNDVKGPFIWEENGVKMHCPYYRRWASMLDRCYSQKVHKRNPSYIGCYVCEEWLTFSNFKSWMQTQDWQGKHLDKDLLVMGNKVYSPETSMFISVNLNAFIVEKGLNKNKYLLGAYIRPDGSFSSTVVQLDGKLKYIGRYKTQEEAHFAWAKEKLKLATELAAQQTDERVANALIERYKHYADSVGQEKLLENAKISAVINDMENLVKRLYEIDACNLILSDVESALIKINEFRKDKKV